MARPRRGGPSLRRTWLTATGGRYISLRETPVADNTALYQTAPVFVFLLSIVILRERVTVLKTTAVLLCVAGALLVTLAPGADRHGGAPPAFTGPELVVGYSLCLCSTIAYALFEVLYKKKACSDDDEQALPNSQRFLGLVGVSVLLLLPLFPVLHYAGVEHFVWPSPHQWRLVFLNAVRAAHAAPQRGRGLTSRRRSSTASSTYRCSSVSC